MNIIHKFLLKPTYKNAAHAKCYECMGADLKKATFEKGTQQNIKECTCKSCPLYHIRPHQ